MLKFSKAGYLLFSSSLSLLDQDLPEGEKWGATDSKGEPVGDGCLLDMSTAVAGWPSTWEESSGRFHSEPVFKAAFKAARAEKKRVMLTESKWNPPSGVVSTICRAREVYSKIGFLSESEVANLTGATAKALKLTPGTVQLEDRPGETLKGYYISLLGMPSKLRGAVRKIKLVWRIANQVDAYNLQPENQITQDQGLKLFHHMCDTAVETMDSALKTNNRSKLLSYEDMMQKATNLEQDWVHRVRWLNVDSVDSVDMLQPCTAIQLIRLLVVVSRS